MAIYIVQGTLKHDGVTYAPGSEFSSDDEALCKHLRHVGALALPAETLGAEAIAAREAALQARIAELEQEREALAAQVDADKSGSSSEGSEGDSAAS